MSKNYPLLLKPAFKDYIWGGKKIKSLYFPESPYEKTAEAWVLSAHKDGESIVANGQLAGKTFADAISQMDNALGNKFSKDSDFPILIKLIDAEDNLSVQVHPDDNYAGINEGGLGKTEMWYVCDAVEGAFLYYGFNRDVSREEFEKRIKENTLIEVLNAVKVKKGDCFFIPAGTIHAIGKGMLIAEIQQSSNTTYRVYDYGRVGNDGKPRDLHIAKALDVTSTQKMDVDFHNDSNVLADCQYFKVEKRSENYTLTVDENSFKAVMLLEGNAILKWEDGSVELSPADTVFIPANAGKISVEGNFVLLQTEV